MPLTGEIERNKKYDASFPSHSSFGRLGPKVELLETVRRYCFEHPGHEDVIELIELELPKWTQVERSSGEPKVVTGFVYLMKSGRHYKIGRTVSPGSRERQLAVKIPVPPRTIHRIETDDPVGVEAYWHNRFSAKRGEGEWFELSADDVKAFKRWKRIV